MDRQQLVRLLPPVHELVREGAGEPGGYPPHLLTEAAREVLAAWRRRILEEGIEPPGVEDLVKAVRRRVSVKLRRSLRPVINATGVVLHTNLGRAPLSEEALAAVTAVARGYSNLEMDLDKGGRGSRYGHVEDLLRELCGAEAALVVNNNAAAVLLCLSAVARGREVVVSRGELVEIGGSFRVPEVMAQSGAVLKEVGTTNKTYPRDYEEAIGPETALLLKVHPSNYRVLGFTREVTREELVSLGRKYRLPVMEDLGSGMLVDLRQHGLDFEPTVRASLEAGMDLVTFSGDKLLGGPQAGIIVGRSGLLQMLKEHPLLRALRVDKLTLAALEATLMAYRRKDAVETLPVLRMLTLRREEIYARAERLRAGMACRLGDTCPVSVGDGFSRVGGGALPLTELPTALVVLRPKKSTAAELAERLRKGDPPVLARVQEDGVLLDLRTVVEGEEEMLVEAVVAAVHSPAP